MSLSLRTGIELRHSNVGAQEGLALRISPEAIQAGQLQWILTRRFEQARAFDGCFVFLEANGTLVIWHRMLPTDKGQDEISCRLLSLAGVSG